MTTQEAVGILKKYISPSDLIVSSLGRTAEEVFLQVENTDRVLFLDCLGAVPGVAVGISLGCPDSRVFAFETDGSFMYAPTIFHTMSACSGKLKNLVLVIFDNGLLESGGGLRSRMVPFDWEKNAESWGVNLEVIHDVPKLDSTLQERLVAKSLSILVLETDNTGIGQTCHKDLDGIESKYRFKRFIHSHIHKCIIRPCVKN